MQNKTSNNLIGINISSSYGAVTWSSVASNTPKISFSYMRASAGTSTLDANFVSYVKGARSVGIICGGYHDATIGADYITDPITQANYFIQQLQTAFGTGQYGDINPVLVFQTNPALLSVDNLLRWASTFRNRFESVTNRTLIVYTKISFIDSNLNFNYPNVVNGNRIIDMPLWISYYSTSAPPNDGGWTKWLMWQYTDTGTVSGITGNVSLSAGPVLIQDLQEFVNPTIFDDNLYVTDSNLNLKVVLSNKNNPMQNGSCPYSKCFHTEQLNKMNTLTFEIPSDNADSFWVKAGNCVYYRNFDYPDQIELFEIIRVEESHNNVPIKNVYCEHKVFELIDGWIDYIATATVSFETALASILGISKWSVGIIQVPGTKSFGVSKTNKMDAIQKLIATFGVGELRFRVQILNNGVVNYFVDVLNPRGSFIGKRFEYTKDLKGIKRTIDSTSLITMAYGYGSGDPALTFASVVWTTPTNPTNKPAGQIWVQDTTALRNYGRYKDNITGYGTVNREGTYTNNEQTDAGQLLQETWNYIQQHNFPFTTYEMDATDFEFLFGYPFEKVRLGDIVEVIDYDLQEDVAVQIRIVEINRCLDKPEDSNFTVGNIVPVLGGTKA